jgi:hypothetical protein
MINQCLRRIIFNYIRRYMKALEPRRYNEYFELNKIFSAYMHAFGNRKFNQDIEDVSMQFVNTSLTKFTDKRSNDYQRIKKFVASAFVDMGFLKEKEVVEMFKTRRKRKEDTK